MANIKNKIPSITGLITNAAQNTKVTETKIKITNTSGLVRKNGYDLKIKKVVGKFITSFEINKVFSDNFDAKIKKQTRYQKLLSIERSQRLKRK